MPTLLEDAEAALLRALQAVEDATKSAENHLVAAVADDVVVPAEQAVAAVEAVPEAVGAGWHVIAVHFDRAGNPMNQPAE